MIIGSSSRCRILAGMIARPRATPSSGPTRRATLHAGRQTPSPGVISPRRCMLKLGDAVRPHREATQGSRSLGQACPTSWPAAHWCRRAAWAVRRPRSFTGRNAQRELTRVRGQRRFFVDLTGIRVGNAVVDRWSLVRCSCPRSLRRCEPDRVPIAFSIRVASCAADAPGGSGIYRQWSHPYPSLRKMKHLR